MAKQTPAERLFSLTCALLAAPVSGLSKQQLYAAVEGYAGSSGDAREKLFDRDKGTLRDMGVALEVLVLDAFEENENARYRIAKGSFDWPKDLKLNATQLQLLELAARSWNNRLISPIAQSGLTRMKSLGVVAGSKDLSFFTPRLIAKHNSFEPLAVAISEQKLVGFQYRKPDGSESVREVLPVKLRYLSGQWILLALEKSLLKNFLLRRIVSEVSMLGNVDKQVTESQIASAESELEELIQSQVARLKLTPDSEAHWHFGADATEIELNYMDEALLAEDLMEFGPDVQIIFPQSLKQRIRAGFEKVVEAHA